MTCQHCFEATREVRALRKRLGEETQEDRIEALSAKLGIRRQTAAFLVVMADGKAKDASYDKLADLIGYRGTTGGAKGSVSTTASFAREVLAHHFLIYDGIPRVEWPQGYVMSEGAVAAIKRVLA